MTLAERIRRIREEKGMTQKQVASLMGISQQAYGQYESGAREPKPETLGRISAALGESASDLLKYSFPLDEKKQEDYENRFIHGIVSQDSKEFQIFERVLDKMPRENDLLCEFSKLNDRGKLTAIERVHELTLIPQYQCDSSEIPGSSTFLSSNEDSHASD